MSHVFIFSCVLTLVTEMQIFHLHPGRRRLLAQAVVIRAQSDGYNYYFQEALDAFQREFDNRMQECQRRNLADDNSSYESWARVFTFGGASPRERVDFGAGPWDPHHQMLVPTIYFYRYDGSLTEPPCGEFVTWWVADRPMTIGLDQWEQMQRILFLSLDASCNKMSVQYQRGVARPIQKTNNRPVWRCSPLNFGPDLIRG
jgi:Eukaryotic-type carbonic anhydrase